ncbi:CPBP family intramembrane metalloprotease [Massilia sp. CCM 8733]|uniref:CPBP family intramembrane metalloprotease n=1 Tax=Massilia mucilaginosa TaxID=2609282 RepID=A0ABX0NWF6_9BURK|nr:CPBP family intramembrane glutamic endopeptidase [Massilia mucilaginosa]NHZ91195.1 CPBP family intramembrane metalloprotease [Massilia mucilaginosa]
MTFKVTILIFIFSMVIRAGFYNAVAANWPESTYYAEHIAIVAMYATLTIACIIQFKITREKFSFIMGNNPTFSQVCLSISIAILLLMLSFGENAIFTFSYAQFNLENAYDSGKFHSQPHQSHSVFSWMIMSFILSSVILPALIEEVFFRALIFRSLYKNFSFFKSALATATFFTCIHFSQPIYISTFIFSFVLSYLYATTRSLPTCMIVHATFNLLAFLIQHYFDLHRIRTIDQLSHLQDWIPELVMLGFAISAFSLLIVWAKDRLTQAALPHLPLGN